MTLLAPWLMTALVLASIPLIIHLLNRRRFIRVDWAPMKYLKLTIKKSRRRLQLEQWLLLLLRTLVIVLFVVAFARPVASYSGLGQWLSAKSRKARIIVLDDSVSMGHVSQKVTAFRRAQDATIEIVRATSTGDQLTVFTTSRPNQPLARHAQLEDPTDLIKRINASSPTGHTSYWASTLQYVAKYLDGASYPLREVVLVTDLRRTGWNDEVKGIAETLSKQDLSLRVIDVGRINRGNLSVSKLNQVDPIALSGTRLQMEALVENHSSELQQGTLANVIVNGQAQTLELPDLVAGESTPVRFHVATDQPGQWPIRFELPPDELAADNVRYAVVDVRSAIDILLVDGEPSNEAFGSETAFLKASFMAGNAPWNVTVVEDHNWTPSGNERPDVVVLANIGRLSGEQIEYLKQHTREGMGIVFYTGGLMEIDAYNRALLGDINPLLPVKLGDIVETEVAGLKIEPWADSPLGRLARLTPEVLTRVRPTRIMSVKETEAEEIRVLARWNHAQQSPALIERRVGQGVVYLWTMTADRAWSNWPLQPSFVLAMREIIKSAASGSRLVAQTLAGQAIQHEVELDNIPETATVDVPGGEEKIEIDIDVGDTRAAIVFEDTLSAGFYTMQWETGVPESEDNEEKTNIVAVNIDPRESQPQTVDEQQLAGWLQPLDWSMIRAGQSVPGGTESELWRNFIWIVLALVGVEGILAAWVSREQ